MAWPLLGLQADKARVLSPAGVTPFSIANASESIFKSKQKGQSWNAAPSYIPSSV